MAQNLVIFSQIAEGIDERTWLYHLHQGDYSRWFRHGVNDRYLADQARHIEQRRDLDAAESRKLIRGLSSKRDTLSQSRETFTSGAATPCRVDFVYQPIPPFPTGLLLRSRCCSD
jgi:hypothetical protein